MRRKLVYSVNHFITFFPDNRLATLSNSHCCGQVFYINTNIKTSKKASLFASHGIVRTNSVD